MNVTAAPLPGATRLPRNKVLTPILEALDGYREALDDAELAAAHLRELLPIPREPSAAPPCTAEWHRDEDENDTVAEKLDRWRNRALGYQRHAIAVHNSILTANLDHILNQLHLRLVEVLLTAAPDAEALIAAGVDTAEQAIEADHVPEWSRLQQETWPDYAMLRGSQESIHLHVAPDRIWMSARPSIDGEDPASLLWFKNLPQLWPDWRERGRTRPQFTITGSPPRPEPWPRPDGAEFLIWSFKAGAEHWIPDTKQFDEEFGPRRQQLLDNLDAPQQPDDESSPFDSLLYGPLEAERQRQTQAADTSFEGHPPPIFAQPYVPRP